MTSEAEYHRKIKQLEQELQQAKAREEQERREKEQLERQIQKTTLEDYLLDCHLYIFKALQVADVSLSSTGGATNVDCKYYPLWLRPWENFASHNRDHFDKIKDICGRKQLFSQSIATRDKTQDACMNPAAYERDVGTFLRVAVEAPVSRIFQRLVEEDVSICQDFNFSELRFSCNHRELKQERESDQAVGGKNARAGVQKRLRRSGPNKRVASDQDTKTPEPYPDGYGMRTHPEGSKDAAFVYDYKAARKLTTQNLHQALAKEKLFMEVTEQICSNKVNSDKELNKQDAANVQVAMALTQVFHYMITRNVAYGYVTAGNYILFLHVKKENLTTLYYHLCEPDKEAENKNGTVDLFYTAVAQLVSFCLLSLRSKPLPGSLVDKAIEEEELKTWGNPYDEAASLVRIEGVGSSQSEPSSQGTAISNYSPPSKVPPARREFALRSRSTCRDVTTIRKDDEDDDEEQDDSPSQASSRMPATGGANKRKEGPSSSSSEGNNHEPSSDSYSPPAGQYCTQGCLLGLKRGWDLDEKCPNVSLHRTGESGTRHPINASELASLIGERLRRNPYQDCIALDPYGFSGKIGAIGALFKLSLAQYGYTLVAKGTQSAHLSHLVHESFIYSRLEKLQGEVLPVFLGIVDLTGGYLLPGGARVIHMMLMSWGGEVAAEVGLSDVSAMVRRSSQAVRNEGVIHGDEREPNMLWNEERGRIMLIDFDRAALRPPAKHKEVSKFSGKKRKLWHDVRSCDPKHVVMNSGRRFRESGLCNGSRMTD